jgi:hypothetical protein
LYRTGPVLAAIALALVLASCGGGGSSSVGTTGTEATATSGAKLSSATPGSLAERAGTTAKRKGAAGTSPPAEPHRGAKPDDGSPTSNGITYSGDETPTFEVAKRGGGCEARLGDLVDRMDDLRQALLAGLDYSEYVLRVQAVRAAYEAVPVDRLGLACVAGPANDAEDAFNQYLRAANLWGQCAGTAGCAASSIESRLQYRWKVASKSLEAAKQS